jgi:DNA-binding transcriptional regulator YdaS (Cro superfamily)
MEVLEYLKIRGNKAKVAKAVGVSDAYISQSVKAGKFSASIEAKIVEYINSQSVEAPAQG